MVEKVLQLRCDCNQYPWGKQGSKSLAAVLASKTPGSDFKIDESKNYSEMWMGTYPELPSTLISTGEDLQEVINKHKEDLVGRNVIQKFGHSDLPFLPKVLSIQKALPLQLHPNKKLAAELHKKDPDNFTDPNHKPEIALALGPFEAFCGFKPLDQIAKLLELEPLKQFMPPVKKPEFDDQSLKHVVRSMLSADEKTVSSVEAELSKLSESDFGKKDAYIHKLIPRLQEQYTERDPGTLVALITMNFLTLDKGDSIYIPADGIHAYLSGDIIECMARSNNVLNTGFCPAADRNSVDLFCSCLTFTPHNPKECMLPPKPYPHSKNGKTQLYAPPMSEFNMLSTELGKGESEEIGEINGPSILLVTKGKGKLRAEGKEFELSDGYVFFIGQGVKIEYEATEGLQIFRPYVD